MTSRQRERKFPTERKEEPDRARWEQSWPAGRAWIHRLDYIFPESVAKVGKGRRRLIYPHYSSSGENSGPRVVQLVTSARVPGGGDGGSGGSGKDRPDRGRLMQSASISIGVEGPSSLQETISVLVRIHLRPVRRYYASFCSRFFWPISSRRQCRHSGTTAQANGPITLEWPPI